MIKNNQYVNIYEGILRHLITNPCGKHGGLVLISSSDIVCSRPLSRQQCVLCKRRGGAYTLSYRPIEVWEIEGRPALKFLAPPICNPCRYYHRDLNKDLLNMRPSFARMWELKIDRLMQQEFHGRYKMSIAHKFFDMFYSGCALETFCYSEEDNLLLNPKPKIQLEFRRRTTRSYDGQTETFENYLKALEK